MRFALIVILLGLLIAGCNSRNKSVRRQVVGTWQHQGGVTLAISDDGSFSTVFAASNHTVVLELQGTWATSDDVLVMTLTNVDGTIRHEPVGSVDRSRIIEVDSNHLALALLGQTNYYERK